MVNIRPIFIFGYMRSGTTLVFNILAKHPDIFTRKGEPKIIDYMPIIQKEYPDLFDNKTLENYTGFVANVIRGGDFQKLLGQPFIDDKDFGLDQLHQLCSQIKDHERNHYIVFRLVYDAFAEKNGKLNWCIKGQVVEVPTMMKYFSDASFIEIVRDPRDMLSSKKMDRDAVWHSERYKPEQRPNKDLHNTYDPLWDTLSWKAEIRAGRSFQNKYPNLLMSIRYEDLVFNPTREIERLCAFLNLSFTPQMLEINHRNSSEWDKKYKGIGSESVSKWRKRLKPAEIALCQLVTKNEMRSFNYEFAPVSFIDYFNVLGLLFRSMVEFFLRLKKRFKLGGLNYLINVLVIYWKKLLVLNKSH